MIDKAYGRFADRVSDFIGTIWSLLILVSAIVLSGVYAGWSDRWERVLHLAMAFLALIAVFFLQRSQRHDDKAINLKLDELVKSIEGARENVAEVEKQPEEVIDQVSKQNK